MQVIRRIKQLKSVEKGLYDEVISSLQIFQNDLLHYLENGLNFRTSGQQQVTWTTVRGVRFLLHKTHEEIMVKDFVFKNHIL